MANFLAFDKASEFKSIQCVFTSSVPNVESPKAQLKERTIDKDLKSNQNQ